MKAATFYLLYEHLYTTREPVNRVEQIEEVIISQYGDTEFLRLIADRKAEDVWVIIDELMEAVKVLQPKLYNAVLDKLKDLS